LATETRFINPETMFVPPGYTQVVETTGPGRIVYIAGQLGIDKDGRLPGDFRSQAIQTYENLKEALAAVGGTFEHLVKMTNYLLDIAYLPVIRDVRGAYLNNNAPPASTTIQVSGFARVGAQLEIEAVAVLPANGPRAKTAAKKAKSAAKSARPSPRKPAKKPSAAKKPPPAKKSPAKKKRR
jgi:enamine deaminase RidA (YjgF/YER057c/UK114 family)